MTVDRCCVGLRDCGPVVALLRGSDGYTRPHCRPCLDARLDAADAGLRQEPLNLWWIEEEEARAA